MNLLAMAWRSVRARPVVTFLSVVSIALGTALVCVVLSLHRASEEAFEAEIGSFEMVVGAKGSPLQLILSSLYFLDRPTGNIRYSALADVRSNRLVRAAVPIGLGDSIQGYPIVGTEALLFKWRRRGRPKPLFELAQGRMFERSFEAVLGAEVARKTGLKVGDTFAGMHGMTAGGKAHDEFPFTVVGILDTSGMSVDRAAFATLDSVWKVHEHPDDDPNEEKELTAILVSLQSIPMRWKFMEEMNANTESMAASPLMEMQRLRNSMIRPLQRILLVVAALVILVACLAVLATLLQASEQRRRDRAVLRALGAFPAELFTLVLLEAMLTVLIGVTLGWLIGHGALAFGAEASQANFGMNIHPWATGSREIKALLLILSSGFLAGLIPAAVNYRRSPVRDLKA